MLTGIAASGAASIIRRIRQGWQQEVHPSRSELRARTRCLSAL